MRTLPVFLQTSGTLVRLRLWVSCWRIAQMCFDFQPRVFSHSRDQLIFRHDPPAETAPPSAHGRSDFQDEPGVSRHDPHVIGEARGRIQYVEDV